MSLLTALIAKNSHILAEIYIIFLEKHPTPKLKGFQYQIRTSVKGLGRTLLSKTKFSALLQIGCSNFRLNCIKVLRVTNIVKKPNLKKSEAIHKQEALSRDNHSQDI